MGNAGGALNVLLFYIREHGGGPGSGDDEDKVMAAVGGEEVLTQLAKELVAALRGATKLPAWVTERICNAMVQLTRARDSASVAIAAGAVAAVTGALRLRASEEGATRSALSALNNLLCWKHEADHAKTVAGAKSGGLVKLTKEALAAFPGCKEIRQRNWEKILKSLERIK